MFLGHGAVLRRRCWGVVGGFPEIVSEDLAYAIRIREHGWRGYFVKDVVCYMKIFLKPSGLSEFGT